MGQFEIVRSTSYAVLMELPIACTLTEIEMRGRRRTILDSVRGAALTVTPLPLGYAYRFEPTSEVLAQLARLVIWSVNAADFSRSESLLRPVIYPSALK